MDIMPVIAQTRETITVSGRVTDSRNRALPSATIQLRNAKEPGGKKVVQSDSTGLFSFAGIVPGVYILEVSNVGYDTLMRELKTDVARPKADLGDLILKSNARILQDFSIKADIPPVRHLVDRIVIDIGQNITTAGGTVWEALRKLPGLNATPDGQITLNGKPGVNVLIDGKPTYLSAADLQALLSDMQTSGILRVELMANPSAKYDAAGIGGIINIVRKKNTRSGLNGSVNAVMAMGYYASYNTGFNLSYKNDRFSFFVNNSYSYSKRFTSIDVNSSNIRLPP